MKNPALTERGDPSDNRSSRGNEAHFTQRLWTFACQTALPDDLEHTCVEQVAYWYQNRFRLGLISIPAEGRTFYLAQSDLLPQVQSILKRYERYSLNTRIAADVSPWVKQTLLMIYKPRRRHHDRVRKNYYSSFIEERPARARVFEPLVNSANPDRMNWSLQRHWWPHRLQDNLCRIPRFDPVKCSLREIRSILCAGVSESGHEAPKPSHRCDQPQNESNDDDFFETRHAAWTECITGRSSVHSPLVRTTLRYTVEYKRKIADPTLIS